MKASTFNALAGTGFLPVDVELALVALQAYVDESEEGTRAERLRAVQPKIYSLVAEPLEKMVNAATDQVEGAIIVAKLLETTPDAEDHGTAEAAKEILNALRAMRTGASAFEPASVMDGSFLFDQEET